MQSKCLPGFPEAIAWRAASPSRSDKTVASPDEAALSSTREVKLASDESPTTPAPDGLSAADVFSFNSGNQVAGIQLILLRLHPASAVLLRRGRSAGEVARLRHCHRAG
jgi:hypothetical protein